MRYPYEVLLGGYTNHPIMGEFLQDNYPNFVGMMNSEYWESLSTTENLFWRIAYTFSGGVPDKPVTLDEFGRLDRQHMWRLCGALITSRQNVSPKVAHDEWLDFMGGLDWDAVPDGR